MDKEEASLVSERVTAFNTIIAQSVEDLNLSERVAIVDISSELNTFYAGGVFVDGVLLTPAFAPPFGAFSEDGVHPNTRGYAYIANLFIDAINQKFDANVLKVQVSTYPGTALPLYY